MHINHFLSDCIDGLLQRRQVESEWYDFVPVLDLQRFLLLTDVVGLLNPVITKLSHESADFGQSRTELLF